MAESTQWLLDMLLPMINGAKQRRKAIENEWLLNYRAWQGWPSQSYTLPLPDNAIHYFIPHARRAIEKRVKVIKKYLTSAIRQTQVLPSDSSIPHSNVEAVQTVIDYCVTKKIPLRRNLAELARVTLLYDFPILHTSVTIQKNQVWPYQKVVDPYSFYIYPDTSVNLEDAILLFEEVIIPFQVYKSFVGKDEKNSFYKSLTLEELHIPEWPYHLVERIAYRGLTIPSDFNQGSTTHRYIREADVENARTHAKESLTKQSKAFVQLFKCYFRLGSTWFFTVICNNSSSPKIVRLDEEENAPTYRWTNTRSLPGELYTNSDMDDIRVLQNLTNTSLSQMEAQRSAFAEPPIGVDLNAVGRMQEYTFGNRKFWKVDGNPKEIFQTIDVQDTSRESMIATQIYMGLIDKGSGGTLAAGNPGRNMPRSGEAVEGLLDIALIEDEDIASTLETDILSPSLGDIYHNILEYVPSTQLVKIPGLNVSLVKQYIKTDLEGDFSFNWLSSLGIQNQQVKFKKFIEFWSLLMNPQIFSLVSEQLKFQGKMIDLVEGIRTAYTYSLGERGLGELIVDIPPQVLQAMQQAQSQPSPEMALVQIKAQEAEQKGKLALLKGQTSIEEHRAKLVGHQLDNQGKLFDLAQQKKELESSHLDHTHKKVNILQALRTLVSEESHA